MKGSVYKRCRCPVIRNARGERLACKKDHGSWTYVADLGRSRDGVRLQQRKGGFRTRGDAEDALRDLLTRLSTGQYHRDETKTIEQWLTEWIEQKVRSGLRPTTERSYRQHMRDYLIPHLGRIRLRDLRPGHIQGMLALIAAAERPPSRTTQRRIVATLSSALKSAVKAQAVSYNAARLAELPKADRPKVQPWEPEELGRFLDHAAGMRLGALYELMAMTGLRRGEALALHWSDVDLEAGVLVVRKSKTAAGERRVDLGPQMVGVLLAHRIGQDAERDSWGEAYAKDDLVFAREDGTPLDPTAVTKQFRALAAEAGLRPVRLHDLRHGAASLMIAGGLDLSLVSKLLGHSGIAITNDTYTHLLQSAGQAAAKVVEDLVPRVPRDHCVTTSGNPRHVDTAEDVLTESVSAGQTDERGSAQGGPPGGRTRNPRIKSAIENVTRGDGS